MLCSSAVNSQRLLCSQKADIRIKGYKIRVLCVGNF